MRKFGNHRARWWKCFLLLAGCLTGCSKADTERLAEVRKRIEPALKAEVEKAGFKYGAPIFIRAFKESSELELWIQETDKKTFKLFKAWSIANYGGEGLGPKLQEGDSRAPEGFYAVAKSALNPQSDFHLAFNVGYPNAYDRAHERTGGLIMVHGAVVSCGCFAMTNPVIEQIYLLAEQALRKGQPFFRVHIFPFRMTDERMAQAKDSPWMDFWKNLREGYDAFEEAKIPPNIEVVEKRYQVKP